MVEVPASAEIGLILKHRQLSCCGYTGHALSVEDEGARERTRHPPSYADAEIKEVVST